VIYVLQRKYLYGLVLTLRPNGPSLSYSFVMVNPPSLTAAALALLPNSLYRLRATLGHVRSLVCFRPPTSTILCLEFQPVLERLETPRAAAWAAVNGVYVAAP